MPKVLNFTLTNFDQTNFMIKTSFIECNIHENIAKKYFKMLETMMNGKWKLETKENSTILQFDSESENLIFGSMKEEQKEHVLKCLFSNIYKKEGEMVDDCQFLLDFEFFKCFYNLVNYLGVAEGVLLYFLEQDAFTPTVKLFLYKFWNVEIPEKNRIMWLFKVETGSDTSNDLPIEILDRLVDDELISLSAKIKIYANHVSKHGRENYGTIAEKIKNLYESCRNLLVPDNFDSIIQDHLLEFPDIFKERTQVDENDTKLFESETFVHYYDMFLEVDADDESYELLTKLKLSLEQHDSDAIYWWYFKFQNTLPDNLNIRFYCTCDNTDNFIEDWIVKLHPIHLKDYPKPMTISTDQGFEGFDNGNSSYINLHAIIVIEKENPSKRIHDDSNDSSKKQKLD